MFERPDRRTRTQSRRQRSSPCLWTFQKSEVEGDEYQDDPYIHGQPFPELVLEEQDVYSDDHGCQQQYVKDGVRLSPISVAFKNPSRFENTNSDEPSVELGRDGLCSCRVRSVLQRASRACERNGWP